MLLTIAWSSSLIVSRCSLDKNGVSIDKKGKGFSLTKMVCIVSSLIIILRNVLSSA